MSFKIVADSSSDISTLTDIPFTSVPLKIITNENEYTDNENLDVNKMIDDLLVYKGVSHSSCPNSEDFKNAFSGFDNIFCITITGGLSGSYNAASLALEEYLKDNPNANGYVIDSLSAGPEIALIIEKLSELIKEGFEFNEIVKKIEEYKKTTHLIFALESMRNLANNGRVSGAVAKIAGLLGIRVIGQASSEGTLEIISKARGEKKALGEIIENIKKRRFHGGHIRIHHCRNEEGALKLKEMIKEEFENAQIIIEKTKGLCSFYAEDKGLLIGFDEE
ncbi:MAG: DegV family protein [Clostridia bacterium]|nr:DegV family protein [Clostridia bacterium]